MHELRPVSVIIPAYNEENAIIPCLESLIDGDYPLDKLEFIIADGNSSDRTLEVLREFASENKNVAVKIVNNAFKTQGYGLNIAIENADIRSEIILRADAHSIYPQNYILDCVKTLLKVDADNAGGVMVPVGKTPFQKAVAFCMSHPIGVGNAKFHLGGYSGFVDTVYLGCFKKNIFEKVGLFDPMMTPNEDAELNLRILKSGGKIYLNSNIRVEYFPRNTMKKLIIQYVRYGRGRCRTFKKHGKFTSFRQIIPPLWVMLTLFFIIGIASVSKLFAIPLLMYFFILLSVSIKGAMRNKDISILMSPICFIAMHYSWGAGFIIEQMQRDRFKITQSTALQ